MELILQVCPSKYFVENILKTEGIRIRLIGYEKIRLFLGSLTLASKFEFVFGTEDDHLIRKVMERYKLL